MLVSAAWACQGPPVDRKRVRSDAEREAAAKAEVEAGAEAGAEEAKPPPAPEGVHAKIGREQGGCARTLCFAGRGEPGQPPNRHLSESCRRMSGVVKRCEGERCQSLWPVADWSVAFDAVIASLDKDGDGRYGDEDPACELNVVGWSEGGRFAALDVPRALREDGRVSDARARVQNMVLIAPLGSRDEGEGSEDAEPQLRIPDNVAKAWIYRHTKTPPQDCSLSWEPEGEALLSPAPVCAEGTQCWDYDYSFDPSLAFKSSTGARAGSVIGHCNIVAVAAKVAPTNVNVGEESFKPYLPRLSDGREAGRPIPEGPEPPAPGEVEPGPDSEPSD